MPNLANHNIVYSQHIDNVVFYGFFIMSPLTLLIMASLSLWAFLFGAVIGMAYIYGYHRCYRTLIQSMVHEVWDNGDHLHIKKGEINFHLDYQEIDNVEYCFNPLLKARYFIKIHVKQDNPLGNPICFVSWADSCNYGREFCLFPKKTAEMTDWVYKINGKINP